MISFAPTRDSVRELIDLAFSKKKADDRKEWLRQLKVSIVPIQLEVLQADLRLYSRSLAPI